MTEPVTIARPYAKAAFAAASGADVQHWFRALQTMNEISRVSVMRLLLADPMTSALRKAEIFLAALEDATGVAANTEVANFVKILAANKRLSLLPEINDLFAVYKAQGEKTLAVTIETAMAVGEERLEELRSKLSRRLERHVKLTEKVNDNLIGGAVIRIGDSVIDGSVRGRLQQLAQRLEVSHLTQSHSFFREQGDPDAAA